MAYLASIGDTSDTDNCLDVAIRSGTLAVRCATADDRAGPDRGWVAVWSRDPREICLRRTLGRCRQPATTDCDVPTMGAVQAWCDISGQS